MYTCSCMLSAIEGEVAPSDSLSSERGHKLFLKVVAFFLQSASGWWEVRDNCLTF